MVRRASTGESGGGVRKRWDDRSSNAPRVPRGLAIFQPGASSATIALPTDAETIVCDCLQVPLATVRACIARGLTTQEELAAETGVTTVCGGCTLRVSALLGEGNGFRARLCDVREILPGVRSFRFQPLDRRHGELQPALPGQHIVVSGTIGGRLVSRPYTLTSPAGEQEFYEISVKREPDGLFSEWLFAQTASSHEPIYITDPRGDFHVDLAEPDPVIFLVAGIGVTPAIALARTLESESAAHSVHIDYSARQPEAFAFRDELERLSRATDRLRVLFRSTESGHRLHADDVRRYHRRLPDGRFRICGPDGYREDVQRYLAEAGVEEHRVLVEQFTPVRVVTTPGAAPRRLSDTLVRTLGVILLAAYLAQGVLGWTWGWLEALQEQESFRRWSGGALLSLIALQWTLPVLRLRGQLRAAAKVYPWHRWLGALSPALFYAHATGLGYGYLVALGSVYLANVVVGLADKTLIADLARRERYGRVWLVPHVCLAFLTLGLAIFHVFVVLGYR